MTEFTEKDFNSAEDTVRYMRIHKTEEAIRDYSMKIMWVVWPMFRVCNIFLCEELTRELGNGTSNS